MNTKKEAIKKENMRKSNQESKSLTRQYIKTALLYLMKETTYDKITVTAIINRAGVSRAGFYRNYSSKEEVLEDISATYVEQYLNPQSPEEHYRYMAVVHAQRALIIDWFTNGMKESPDEMAKIFF